MSAKPASKSRSRLGRALLPVTAAFLLAEEAEAQRFTQVSPPPNQPAAEGFDPDRALFFAESNFQPLRDPEWRPLDQVLRAGDVRDDQPVLVFEAGGETLVLVSAQMSYHHVAQGDMAGEPWMVTF
jgi:hypothetical protein